MKVDAAFYDKGREMFNSGGTIREVIELTESHEAAQTATDDQVASLALGFADGLLDKLRRL